MNLNQRVPGELNCFKVKKDQEVLRESRSLNSSGVTLRGEMGQKDPLAISDNVNTSSTWVWRGGATCAWEVGFGGGNHHVGAGSRKVVGLDYGIASPHWTARPSHGNRTES